MSNNDPFIGPALGSSADTILYCLDSDESSMIYPESKLSEKSKEDDEEYTQNNSAFTLSVLPLAKQSDHIILDATYLNNPQLFKWQMEIYENLSLKITQNIYYAPVKKFAKVARELIREKNIDTLSVIGYSYILLNSFSIRKQLEISQKVNSKTSLPELSVTHGFPIPPSKLFDSSTIKKIPSFRDLNMNAEVVYLKSNGLGGGYNVTRIETDKDLEEYIATLPLREEKILVQAATEPAMIEKEHIFIVYENSSRYLYSSVQLTENSAWYGNVFIKEDSLTESQHLILQKAISALQSEGYCSEKGLLVGFDTKLNQQEIQVLEINARWLGSLPVERILRKLELLNKETVFSSFDYISDKELSKYMEFAEKYLYGCSKSSFSIIPISYSAYTTKDQRLICFAIIGSLADFNKARKKLFGQSSFTMLETSINQIRRYKLIS